MQLELIERNPMASAPPPPAPQREIVPPEVATVREMLRLAQAEAHSLFPFLHTLTYSGMRRGECLALRWSNVDLEEGYIRVVESAVHTQHRGMVVKSPKTAKGMRTVDLDIRTVEVLRQHRAAQICALGDVIGGISRAQLVFPARHGGFMKPTTITRKLKTLGRRVGAPNITFHSLRHFHATLALQQRQNVVVVSRRLGHSSVTTTLETYGHVMPGWQKDVAEAFAQAMEAPQ